MLRLLFGDWFYFYCEFDLVLLFAFWENDKSDRSALAARKAHDEWTWASALSPINEYLILL